MRSTAGGAGTVAVAVHTPDVLHMYTTPGYVAPTQALSPTTGEEIADNSNASVVKKPLNLDEDAATLLISISVFIKLLLIAEAASPQLVSDLIEFSIMFYIIIIIFKLYLNFYKAVYIPA